MSQTINYLDVPVFKLTNGRLHLGSGYHFLLLTTTGARSGKPRSTPLFYVEHHADSPDDSNSDSGPPFQVAIIGSNFGREQHPAWSHNLRADPHCTVTLDRRSRPAVARLADDAESQEIWEAATRSYSGFGKYPDWIRDRTPPVFILTLASAASE
ncbi:MAG TPA: nitroreductase family deazaflavin-dependent oxidoreductase [Dehalococcoidia bacterium]|nr:nitroreductase family deazaflavin-dependent oxidoreductase [Dehalococcoidia bacterium]